MSTYLDFPPINLFEKSLKHCPQSAFIYKELWRFADDKWSFSLQKTDIIDVLGITPTKLKNHLLTLKREGLLNLKFNKKTYKIDLLCLEKSEI